MTPVLPEAFRTAPLAHRGLHDLGASRPENTLAAIRAAISGRYGIEIDVQPSADGQAMVFHDELLDRLTDHRGPVARQPARSLRQMTVLGTEQTIPTLPDTLAMVDGAVPLLIELKDQGTAAEPPEGTLEAAVAAALDGYGGPVAVMSFNPDMVARMSKLAPAVPRGLTTAAFRGRGWTGMSKATRARLQAIEDYERVGASFISHDARDLARPRVAELKREGAVILCWTIRSFRAERAARRVAHNITFEGYLPDRPEA